MCHAHFNQPIKKSPGGIEKQLFRRFDFISYRYIPKLALIPMFTLPKQRNVSDSLRLHGNTTFWLSPMTSTIFSLTRKWLAAQMSLRSHQQDFTHTTRNRIPLIWVGSLVISCTRTYSTCKLLIIL